ncbi:MAG: ubiquinol-cytochrome c reductase iron-sulfur subunit [Planctomycetota bacterium]
MTSESSGSESAGAAPETPRRGVLVQLLTAALSFVIVTVPASLGGLFFLDPILRKKKSGSDKTGAAAARKDEAGFIRLDITRDSVPADGTPVSVTVLDDIVDAWNRFPNVPIGSIWLRKVGDGPILAFSSICPHLGCSVNYRQAEGDFFCPCHTSAFALDGKKTNKVPPRDMDGLTVSMRTDGKEDPAGNEIWVKYEKFRGARADKVAIT